MHMAICLALIKKSILAAMSTGLFVILVVFKYVSARSVGLAAHSLCEETNTARAIPIALGQTVSVVASYSADCCVSSSSSVSYGPPPTWEVVAVQRGAAVAFGIMDVEAPPMELDCPP